jgi:hypothetical protein
VMNTARSGDELPATPLRRKAARLGRHLRGKHNNLILLSDSKRLRQKTLRPQSK